MMMMIPEPWEKHQDMEQSSMIFTNFSLMEPWDGLFNSFLMGGLGAY